MLAEGKARANVLICGKIREIGEFQREVERYIQWRDAGLVDRIVFSCWAEDARDYPGVFATLEKKGFEFIISEQPRLRLVGHAFHQLKSIDAGLTVFGDDDLILRTRTDKAVAGFNLDFVVKRFESAAPPGEGSPFAKRLMIQVCIPFQPYFFNDMIFMGLKRDIARLVSYDLWYELRGAVMNPEQIIHFAPFSNARPVVRDFFMVNPGLIYSNPGLNKEVYRVALKHDLYCAAVYHGLKDALDSYILGFDAAATDPLEQWPHDLGVSDLLVPETANSLSGVSYHDVAATINTRSERAIDRMLHLPVAENGGATLTEIGRDFSRKTHCCDNGWMSQDAIALAQELNAAFPQLAHRRRLPAKEGPRTFYYSGIPMIVA